MTVTIKSEIVKREKQKTEFTVSTKENTSGLSVKLTSLFRRHSGEIKVELLPNYDDNKLSKTKSPKSKLSKLSKIKLYFERKEDKFEIKEVKEYFNKHIIENKSKCDKELSITLKTHLYGFFHILNIKTHKDTLIIEYLSEVVSNHFVSYVNFLNSWWPPEAIAACIGVPPYSHSYAYNKINLAFWTTNQGPVDAALLWQNAITYCGPTNPWGTTTQEIQQAWISLYHQYGVKALVSAFGATDFPTTQGADPIATAEALAAFCINNNLDGVDLDYEDNGAMEAGTGEPWLIACTQKLRELLPTPYIISHAPQAPYFMGTSKYPNGGYLKVNQEVGNLIDFYNIQFYNQDSSKYDTYQSLFNVSDGWAANTAVKQIAANNVDKTKLVVGKGVKPEDYFNTGYVPVNDLATYLKQGVTDGFSAGFMGWQFSSDSTGSWSETLAASF